jgi:SAM-dependent methyltransferase
MLELGYAAVKTAALQDRVQLFEGYLPGAELPRGDYDIIISNSLLHHLADPAVLWREVRARGQRGAGVFVMDLLRPETRDAAIGLRDEYAAGEPEVLREDFFNSLLAAYRADEVIVQLRRAGLESLSVKVVSDRHFIVYGSLD